MLPKPRARSGKRLGWPFGRRRNRRVRKGRERGDATPTNEREISQEVSVEVPRESRVKRLGVFFAQRRRGFITACVGLVLGAGVWSGRWYVTHAQHFRVEKVRVTPLKHVSDESIIARAGVPLGVNLFAVDRDEVARSVAQEPWIAKVKVRLELPATIVIDAVEREAACGVALGSLYLADPSGTVFKRATPDEAAALPIVTGVARDVYVADAEHARADVREALAAMAAWSARPERGRLGEAHVDRAAGLTLYTERGMGVRLGAVDDTLAARLQRLDAVLADLDRAGEKPRLIYVDNRARPDRVTVKLASAINAAQSENTGHP